MLYYPQVTQEETEAQRGQGTQTWVSRLGRQGDAGTLRLHAQALHQAPHQRGLLFCLLGAQPQDTQLHFQGAIGVEAKAVQLDVCSLLPLPETKGTEAASPKSQA
jgi:hypothetical protein